MFLRLIVLFFFLFSISMAEANEKLKQQADSLFSNQKYTEAFELYEKVFLDGAYSESMLLRMAFIKDGLGNYVDALYYLDLYYKLSADKSAVTKIEEISSDNRLQGYQYDDTNFFKAILKKFTIEFQLALLSISLLLTAYIYRKRKQQERPTTATVFQVLVLMGLLFLTNSTFEVKYGIISQNNTLLRSGPSAGADPIEMIEKGHKVVILEQNPVWTKIKWSGEEVFLRNGKIKII